MNDDKKKTRSAGWIEDFVCNPFWGGYAVCNRDDVVSGETAGNVWVAEKSD